MINDGRMPTEARIREIWHEEWDKRMAETEAKLEELHQERVGADA